MLFLVGNDSSAEFSFEHAAEIMVVYVSAWIQWGSNIRENHLDEVLIVVPTVRSPEFLMACLWKLKKRNAWKPERTGEA